MWENNRLLLGFCVVCGVVAFPFCYSLSLYVLCVLIAVCVYLFFFHFKTLESFGWTASKKLSFTLPTWIKNIVTFLMNSYHLSKPLEPESNSRRDSPYSSNLHLPRRGSCRSGHFTCLDENIDYVNRRNGIGLISPNSSFKNSFSENLRDIRRRSLYSESDNSTKVNDISSPHVSPWSRKTNSTYSNSEYSSVRRVQTIAGPLLGSPGYNRRRSTDYGILVDASSPGLASRVVQYREEGQSHWTHQPQYSSPGQFPTVHLNHSPSLPVLSPLNSQKASRRSVRVKIAPPDPLGSRIYPLTSKNNISPVPTDHSTKSVIETLKEISRKRIHSQLEDSDDDVAKRQKRSGHLDSQTSNVIGDGDNISKRTREDSPHLPESSPPAQPAKRIKNNEILSSLSSSRKLLQGGGVKRKTQNVDWSRCSTPILGKQQKTTENDTENANVQIDIGSKISYVTKKLSSTLHTTADNLDKSQVKEVGSAFGKEKNSRSLVTVSFPRTSPQISSNCSVESQKPTDNGLNIPIDDSLWQKDSPFVSVTSPDDIIDDISALEEKREQDRRSRLMSMMAVINGGESPVKSQHGEKNKCDEKNQQSGNGFVLAAGAVNGVADSNAEKTSLFGTPNTPALDLKNNLEGSTSTVDLPPVIHVPVFGTLNTPSSVPALSNTNNMNAPKFTSSLPPYSFGVSPTNTVVCVSSSVASPITVSAVPSATSGDSPKLVLPSLLGLPQQTSSPVLIDGNSKSTSEQRPTLPTSVNSTIAMTNASSNIVPLNFGNQSSNHLGFSSVNLPLSSPTSTASAVATTSPTSSISQIQPSAVSSLQSSLVFNLPVSQGTSSPSSSANLFSKPSVESSDRTILSGVPNSQNSPSVNLFGSISTSSYTPTTNTPSSVGVTGSFTFGTPVTTTSVTTGQAGLFSFGTPSLAQSSQSEMKSTFISPTGVFGQPTTTLVNTSVSNQVANTGAPGSQKVGGFKFDLHEKPLFSSNMTPGSSASVFGSISSSTGNVSSPFTLPASKPAENLFAASSGTNITGTSAQQSQVPVNPFGASAGKSTVNNTVKENLFSFGGSSPSSTGFSNPPATTTSSAPSGSFSFPISGFPSQTTSSAVGFSVQATSVAPTNSTFSTLSTASSPNFTFGSSPAFATPQQPQQQQHQQQPNPFAFSSTPKSQSETPQQPGGMFSFGGSANGAPSLFGQPAASAASAQCAPTPQSQTQAPAPAFQFGSNAQQLPGAFSFGTSTSANPPANSGSFPMSGGFGSGSVPAMFSIGSGSTAPRTRSGRTRHRAK